MNALQGAVIILDECGNIVYKNRKWHSIKDSLSLSKKGFKGENYFEHCSHAVEEGNDYALRLLLGIRDVLTNNKERFRVTINDSSGNKDVWFKVEVSPIEQKAREHVLVVFTDISDELKYTRASRESEALHRKNFNYTHSGIILGKENGEILDVNPAACAMLGYSKSELMEGGRSMIVDEEDPAHKEVVRTRNKKSVFFGEKEYKHKNGHYIPVELTSVKYQSDNNGPYIINTFRKIQHEKDRKHTLEVERRFTKTALNSISGIFFVLDSDRKFVRWNNSMLSDLGYTDEEMMEKTVFDIFAPSERKTINCFLNDAFENGKTDFVGKITSKNSGLHHYHLQFNTFQEKEKTFLVVTGVDRTDFVESEKLREQNHHLMTELFNNSPIATVMIDPDNKAEKINKAFIELFGYAEKELIGHNINTLITSDDLEEEASQISDHAFNGNSDQRSTTRIRKDGTEIPVLLSTVPVWIDGKIIAVYGMYVDLTEQVNLKNHLQKSLEEKDILLQEVHHRVKNNLAIMASLLQLQILNDCNEYAKPKLQEAYGRIFSIAKVHEALYNKEDMAEISFTGYLHSIVETMPDIAKTQQFDIQIQDEDSPLILNVNQAIPLGLLINEIMNLSPQAHSENQLAQLDYHIEGETVTLTLSGLNKQIEEYNTISTTSHFHHMLIETFLQQIDATLGVDAEQENSFKITFERSNKIKGSSNSFINQNINYKTSVA